MYKRFIDNFGKQGFNCVGSFNIPLLEYEEVDLSKEEISEVVAFNNRKNYIKATAIHFFIDDYQFQRIWNNPSLYIKEFKKYRFICSPDFSLYSDMPLALQIFNTYKKQWLACYYQSKGVTIVPTVSWSTKESFKFCFDGISNGMIVSVSSVGCFKNIESYKLFCVGYQEMIKRINPSKILFVGKVPEEFENERIIHIEPFTKKLEKLKI